MPNWTSGFQSTHHILKSPIKKVELSNKVIEDFVSSQYGKAIKVSCSSHDTVCVGMNVDLKLFSKFIELNVTIENINGDDIHLYYTSPTRGMNLLAKGGIMMFSSKLNEKLPMVDFIDDNRAVLHLAQIDQLKNVLKAVKLQELTFASNCVQVGLKLL